MPVKVEHEDLSCAEVAVQQERVREWRNLCDGVWVEDYPLLHHHFVVHRGGQRLLERAPSADSGIGPVTRFLVEESGRRLWDHECGEQDRSEHGLAFHYNCDEDPV